MLVLTLKQSDYALLKLADGTEIKVLLVKHGYQTKIGIEAPKGVRIERNIKKASE